MWKEGDISSSSGNRRKPGVNIVVPDEAELELKFV
jgi:hypothetical protein